MRKQRRFARIALILALFTALVGGTVVLAVASPAMAATCSGNGCNGLDPIATGCQNSYTQLVGSSEIKNGSTHYGWIDLRYSPTCGTNWSRVRSDIGTQNLEAFIIRARKARSTCTVRQPFAHRSELVATLAARMEWPG